jgi:two-component system chemotaxis response regulator CheB
MGKLRVLVVEDSATVRAYLCSVLSSEPDIEVVAAVEDGQRAVEVCSTLRPDVVTLDMILPTMTGVAATEQIMAFCPTPILIVSSSFNRGELFKTYDALAAGAVDVLEKPSGDAEDDAWNRRFLAAVRMVARIRVITHPRARLHNLHNGRPVDARPEPSTAATNASKSKPLRAASSLAPTSLRHIDTVAIGASTGGPGAIVEVLTALPATFKPAILLVLHIGEPFGRSFAEWLATQIGRPVAYAVQGQAVSSLAGRVCMAPPDHHLRVVHGSTHLDQSPERHSCRPSIDVLFESLAVAHGDRVAACLLTGMGRDGAAGLLALRRSGALTIAQDEASSVVYGMPREAALLGAAERILPLREIGPSLGALELVTSTWRAT